MGSYARAITLGVIVIFVPFLVNIVFRNSLFRRWLKKYHKASFEELDAADRIAKGDFEEQVDSRGLLLKPDGALIAVSFFLFLGLTMFILSICYITRGNLRFVVLLSGIFYLLFLAYLHLLKMPIYIELARDLIRVKTLWPGFSFRINVSQINTIILGWFETNGWQNKKYASMTILSDTNKKYYFSLSVLSAKNKSKLLSLIDDLRNKGLKVVHLKSWQLVSWI